MSLDPDDPRHGTVTGYSNHDCRCASCREAWRVWSAQRRRRRGVPTWAEHVAALPKRKHGRRGTYAKGCRCDECREAERLYMQKYRAWH
jgi:hypothetical protein